MTELSNFIFSYRQPIEEALHRYLPSSSQVGAARLNDALLYAVFPGGRRVRPMLALIGAAMVNITPEQAMPIACGVEFIHTSSLILDDLPGMDDASLRRDRTALHAAFGEGVAVLTALALLNQSYALFIEGSRNIGLQRSMERSILELVERVGTEGMIGGQAIDLNREISREDPRALRSYTLKTSSLICLSMSAAAVASDASKNEIDALVEYGECIGMAYQLYDDLLDESEDKRTSNYVDGQVGAGSSSFVGSAHAENARRMAADLIRKGKELIRVRFGNQKDVNLLFEATSFIFENDKDLNLIAES